VRQAAIEGDITKEAMTVLGGYYRVDLDYPDAGQRGVANYLGNCPRRRGPTPDFCLHALIKGS